MVSTFLPTLHFCSLAGQARKLFPSLLFSDPGSDILFAGEIRQFLLQLLVALIPCRINRTFSQSLTDRTPRLIPMPAIAEVTVASHRFNVCKRDVQAALSIPKLQLAHAGSVEHKSPLRQHDQLAVCSRVSASSIVLPRLLYSEVFMAEQVVYESRFSYSG